MSDLLAASTNTASGVLPLAKGVLGIQACALTGSGSYPLSSSVSPNWAVTGSYNGCPVPPGYNALLTDSSTFTKGLTNCTQAIEVWIAIVGDQDYDNLRKLGKIPLLVAALTNQTNPATWRAQVDILSIPTDLKSSIRIHKKIIPLP